MKYVFGWEGENMTENEFAEYLQKTGYGKVKIEGIIEAIKIMKKSDSDVTYDKFIPFVKSTYEKYKNYPDDILSFD